ncbi:HlyD family efflux transporter periplasmic adaptor subunit [Vibrio plantisponsor]|uniref:HlyD family efflux transporter periplasmic adaptor subunit n=1 Tax=Vibrio plantisponsor TaxID=664643 RepID=A0ABU4IFD6_9VIBR|nr:HlyD family efflux transporter periplasmic adaptor subunit [Vibrio plantisponsor]MDW6017270.1 HlyD family efflux transporter periplasmic adaptor subunit [Vibrio plantisponsor]NNM40212.1 HlyD family efflux transporter periplasmic adaptor subunit [Vibrio plantisponsor]
MKSLGALLLLLPLLVACAPDDSSQALGTLERDRVTFSATSNEIIRALPVKEGSQVKIGDVLVKLDTTSQEAMLAQAIAQQAKANAYLTKLTNGERPEDIAVAQAKVTLATAKLTEANKNYRRKAELVSKNLISESEKDTALSARDSARAELDSAKEEFAKLTAGTRVEDIEQAKAELDAAVANTAVQQQKLDELTIVSTRDGVLDNLPYNLGERVSVGSIVAVVQADNSPFARVYVPEPYRVKLTQGTKLQVHVDGVEQTYQGTVRWIANEPSFTPYYALTENERARLMYLAEIDLSDDAQNLPSGIPAQVDLP